jgi:hypothetical protein
MLVFIRIKQKYKNEAGTMLSSSIMVVPWKLTWLARHLSPRTSFRALLSQFTVPSLIVLPMPILDCPVNQETRLSGWLRDCQAKAFSVLNLERTARSPSLENRAGFGCFSFSTGRPFSFLGVNTVIPQKVRECILSRGLL